MPPRSPHASPESTTTISRPQRRLEGRLATPPTRPVAGAVLCHPHPLYGGSMDNAVILALAVALPAAGVATLRFNFGGTGRSQGVYSGGPEEVADAHAALAVLADALPPGLPLTLVGYSFGAYVALTIAGAPRPADTPEIGGVVAIAPPLDVVAWSAAALRRPVAVIAAEHDQYCSRSRLEAAARAHGPEFEIRETIVGADHFFAGVEDAVAAACCRCIAPAAPGAC
jgi:hypothetical protein